MTFDILQGLSFLHDITFVRHLREAQNSINIFICTSFCRCLKFKIVLQNNCTLCVQKTDRHVEGRRYVL
jgi:hypothetical protein